MVALCLGCRQYGMGFSGCKNMELKHLAVLIACAILACSCQPKMERTHYPDEYVLPRLE